MRRWIVVGLGGAGGRQALAWAVEEAQRSDAVLVLLHVCAAGSPLDQETSDPTLAEVELVDPPLAQSLANTRARLGGDRAVLKIVSGDPPSCLVNVSASVDLLVIGAGEGGSTARRILRHAR